MKFVDDDDSVLLNVNVNCRCCSGGIIMFGAFLLFEDDFIHIVSIAFTALILTELLMVALTIRTWHYLMIVGELLSLLLYVASLFLFHSFFGQSHIM